LDRERCILCDRCTRFAKEVAGDPLIHFIDRGSNTEINTFPGEPFSSYFSGNTVQICPVGALTAKPYRFKARPWDLEEVESTCTGCSVGCRITVQSSRNELLRYQGVDSDPVNWSWLCDKGRFGFESTQSDARLGEPMRREGGQLVPVRWSDALNAVASSISAADPSRVAVLGGARLTNESALAWARLAKSVIGTDHTDAQLGDGLPADAVLGLPGASIDEVCAKGGTVLYLGPDPKEELPVLYLRLRHAATNDKVRIIQISPVGTGLSPYAAANLHPRPGESPALVSALLGGEVPADGVAGVSADDIRNAAAMLAGVEELKVVIGRQNLAESADVTMDAIGVIRSAFPSATYLPALRRANVRGALEAGLAPGRLPGRATLDAPGDWSERWGSVPSATGLDCEGILTAAAAGRIDVLILLGADPLSDFPDRELAARALDGADTVVSVDPFVNASAARSADVVLAAAAFGEVDGTTTSCEGRVTVLSRKVTSPGTARADWIIAADLASRLGADDLALDGAEGLWAELVAASPAHAQVSTDSLANPDQADGVLLDLNGDGFVAPERLVLPAQNSYSLRLVVNRALYDHGTLVGQCGSSSGLANEQSVLLSSADAQSLAVAPGDTVTITAQRSKMSAVVVVSSSVPRGVAVMRHNLVDADNSATADPGRIVTAGEAVCEIRVEAG